MYYTKGGAFFILHTYAHNKQGKRFHIEYTHVCYCVNLFSKAFQLSD